MFNLKKKAYILFACFFTIYSTFCYIPFQFSTYASAKKSVQKPKVTAKSFSHIGYAGTTFLCKIASTSYNGNVQYKVLATNTKTKKRMDITKGYSKSFKASALVTVKFPDLVKGSYTVTVYAKRSGVKTNYDSFFTKSFIIKNRIIISKPATLYTQKYIDGDLFINATGATINGTKVNGDIIINPGVDGTAKLDGVNASNIEVKSGASTDGIILNNVNLSKAAKINSSNKNSIDVKVTGATKINSTIVSSDSLLEANSGSFGDINIAGLSVKPLNIEARGTFDGKFIVKSNVNLKVGKDYSIPKVYLSTSNSNNIVSLSGNYKIVEIDKKCQTLIKASSHISQIKVLSDTILNIEKDALVDEIVNTKNKIITFKGQGSKNIPTYKNAISLKDIGNINIGIGESKEITLEYNPNDSTITALSNNQSYATTYITNNKTIRVTGLHKGIAEITVYGKKSGYGSCIETFLVNVSGAKTNQGSLNINPSTSSLGIKPVVTLSYRLGEDYNNGSVIFSIPAEFAVNTNDTISIGNSSAAKIDASLIKGNNVIINNINANYGQTVILTLNNKNISKLGQFNFKVTGDADGNGTEKIATSGDNTEAAVFSIVNTTTTNPGTLVVTPENLSQGTSGENISLMYILGENFNNGKIIFNLPNGFTPSASDTVSVSGSAKTAVGTGAVVGNTFVINNITANAGAIVSIDMNNRTIPYVGKYSFSACADADGSGSSKLASEGTGNETRVINVNPVVGTVPGILTINPDSMTANTARNITLSYKLGENYAGGKVQFMLPNGITPLSSDTVSIAGSYAQQIGYQSISGQMVTINNVNAAAGQVVTLTLFNRNISTSGSYYLSVIGDADGYSISKNPTSGNSNELKVLTVSAVSTISGVLSLSPMNITANSTSTNITLTYSLGENYNNGAVQFTLPTGVIPSYNDSVYVNGTYRGSVGSGAISGQTITIGSITANAGQNVLLVLNNRTLPLVNSLLFTAIGDADGLTGAGKRFSIGNTNEQKELVVSGVQTTQGYLSISPLTVNTGIPNTITLTYTLGEAYKTGRVEFTLPSGITPSYDDIVKINTVTYSLSNTASISSGKVIVNNVTASSGTQVKLILLDKTISIAASYPFSAAGDADGSLNTKSISLGTGNESKVLIAGAVGAPTISGIVFIPANIHQGYTGTPTLIINGTNLNYITSLSIAGDDRLSTLNVISANQVTATLANGKLAGNYKVILTTTNSNTVQYQFTILTAPAVIDSVVYTVNSNNEPLTLTGATGFDNAPSISAKGYSASNIAYNSNTNAITFTPASSATSTGTGDIIIRNGDGSSVTKVNGLVVLSGSKSGALTQGIGQGIISFTTPLADESLSGKVYLVKALTADEAVDKAKAYAANSDVIWNATAATANDSPASPLATSLRGTSGNVYAVWIASNGVVEDAKKLFAVTNLFDLTGVGIDVAAGKLTATTTEMEYSINSSDGLDGSWSSCTSGNTSVNFVSGKVYIREAANKSNNRLVAIIPAPEAAPVNISVSDGNGTAAIIQISGVAAKTIDKLEYKLDNSLYMSVLDNTILNLLGTHTLVIRKAATANTLPSLETGDLDILDLDLTGVSVDVAGGQLTGTTTDMEYSLDSNDGLDGSWLPCTNSNTPVSFVSGKVYIRETANKSNNRLVATIPNPGASPTGIGVSDANGTAAVIQINGTAATANDKLEYKLDDAPYAPVLDTTTLNLSGAHSLLVRKVSTANTLPSLPTDDLDNLD